MEDQPNFEFQGGNNSKARVIAIGATVIAAAGVVGQIEEGLRWVSEGVMFVALGVTLFKNWFHRQAGQ